jgi:hypothetical protein
MIARLNRLAARLARAARLEPADHEPAVKIAKIAVVIPCYNTGRACVDVITRARACADSVLVVDDGSTDDTPRHIAAAGAPCLRLAVNAGKGAALEAGIQEVLQSRQGLPGEEFDYVLTMDGDGQHDPADIPRLIARAARNRADLIVGVRNVRVMPPKSRIGNSFARLVFFLGTGRYVADTQSGFRLMSRSLASRLLTAVSWRRYETEAELLAKAVSLGYTVDTVAISTIYFDRNRGTHFDPLWDSLRVVAVLSRSALAAFAGAVADVIAFAVLLPDVEHLVRTNVLARAVGVTVRGVLSHGDVARTRGRFSLWGIARYGATVIANLVMTTVLLLMYVQLGLHPIVAKILAQLTGIIVTFLAIEAVSGLAGYRNHQSTLVHDADGSRVETARQRAYARAASPPARDIDQNART